MSTAPTLPGPITVMRSDLHDVGRSAGQVAPPVLELAPGALGHGPAADRATTTWSAWASAARFDVEPTTVTPCSRSARHSSSSVVTSSAEETSSAISSSVRGASARASARRCSWPPDSRVPLCPMSSAERRRRPRPGRGRAARSRPRRAASTSWPSRMLSATVPESTRGSCADVARPGWGAGTAPARSTGSPFQRSAPVWCTIPASARSSDDLPEPTGPTTSTSSPRLRRSGRRRGRPRAVLVHGAEADRSSRRSGCRGAVGGAGAVPAEMSTPGTGAE